MDSANKGVSKHLGKIADIMCEWEGPIAEGLGLTPADINAIKMKYPGELVLQTWVRPSHIMPVIKTKSGVICVILHGSDLMHVLKHAWPVVNNDNLY